MLKTRRLFDEAPYKANFNAKVTSIGDDYLVLDQTLFYPESGNQACDTGFIDGRTVNAVRHPSDNPSGYISLDGEIRHYMDVSGFHLAQEITGSIDMKKRILTMRLHSASHLVEYIISSLPENKSVEGSFVDHQKDRTDFVFSVTPTSDDLREIEDKVNSLIALHTPIETPIIGGVKHWLCGDIEMLCCGTHVKNTNEIGKISLKRKNKGKGIIRVETILLNADTNSSL